MFLGRNSDHPILTSDMTEFLSIHSFKSVFKMKKHSSSLINQMAKKVFLYEYSIKKFLQTLLTY